MNMNEDKWAEKGMSIKNETIQVKRIYCKKCLEKYGKEYDFGLGQYNTEEMILFCHNREDTHTIILTKKEYEELIKDIS